MHQGPANHQASQQRGCAEQHLKQSKEDEQALRRREVVNGLELVDLIHKEIAHQRKDS